VCQYVNNTLACNDGNACTTNDRCSSGVCAGTAMACNDNNACTTDSCSNGVCQYVNNTLACNDGNACTTSDRCSNGVCSGTAISCSDTNPCTVDDCDPAGGCFHDPVVCDAGESCVGGVCTPDGCDSDGVCESGEDCSTCPSDCASMDPGCGNGVCEPTLGEDCLNCPADCNGVQDGKVSSRFCCGAKNGDNPVGCSDSRCTSRGYSCSSLPVASCCGDAVCGGYESSCDCEVDCGLPPAVETDCADGLDDDCDGLTDAQDADCPCSATGVACTLGSECCSGVCTRRGVCK